MKATNNNKLVPRPSIILLMRALFASPRTKCSIANTICLLAIALATICAVVLFSSCSTTKQTATDSHITSTHNTTTDSLTAASTQKTTASQATVLGDFVAEQSAVSNTTTTTEEESITETITDITTPERMDGVSAKGYAWGYIGSCLPFVLCLVPVLGADALGISMSMAMLLAFFITAAWWVGMSLPLLKRARLI